MDRKNDETKRYEIDNSNKISNSNKCRRQQRQQQPTTANKETTANEIMPRGGAANYTDAELRRMIDLLEKVLLMSPDEWQYDVADKHAEKFRGRDVDSIRRKFYTLHRRAIPTGNPTCPWYVKQAKRIKHFIGEQACMAEADKKFDLDTQEYEKKELPEGTAPDSSSESDAPAIAPTPTSSSSFKKSVEKSGADVRAVRLLLAIENTNNEAK